MRGCVWVDCDAVSRGRGFESVAESAGCGLAGSWMELSVEQREQRVSGGLGPAGVGDGIRRTAQGSEIVEAAKLVGALSPRDSVYGCRSVLVQSTLAFLGSVRHRIKHAIASQRANTQPTEPW